MGAINWKRVFLGAGVFLLVYAPVTSVSWILLRDLWRETAVRMAFATPENLGYAALVAVLAYVSGVLVTWLYASIRPCYGAGPKTAAMVGVFWWLAAGALPFCAIAPLIRLPWIPGIVTGMLALVVLVGATMAACWVYREPEPRTTPFAKAAAA